jgi:hypothetical protein
MLFVDCFRSASVRRPFQWAEKKYRIEDQLQFSLIQHPKRRVISQLEQEDSVLWFWRLAARIATMREFSTIGGRISYPYSAGRDPDRRRSAMAFRWPRFESLASGEHADLVRGLLLRMPLSAGTNN